MPYEITHRFESALCSYTGARFAVTVNSCTAALMLALQWHRPSTTVKCPKRTYVSVPMSIIHAGHNVEFVDANWSGAYQLAPLPVFDSARRFTSSMYIPGTFFCVSCSASKILAAEQGGAILHDNEEADAWFRRMRFDGRTEGVDPLTDPIKEIAHHCLMTPSVAAQLLLRLHHLPRHNPDMDGDIEKLYSDLSKLPAFQ